MGACKDVSQWWPGSSAQSSAWEHTVGMPCVSLLKETGQLWERNLPLLWGQRQKDKGWLLSHKRNPGTRRGLPEENPRRPHGLGAVGPNSWGLQPPAVQSEPASCCHRYPSPPIKIGRGRDWKGSSIQPEVYSRHSFLSSCTVDPASCPFRTLIGCSRYLSGYPKADWASPLAAHTAHIRVSQARWRWVAPPLLLGSAGRRSGRCVRVGRASGTWEGPVGAAIPL